jgi:hypothetical protein
MTVIIIMKGITFVLFDIFILHIVSLTFTIHDCVKDRITVRRNKKTNREDTKDKKDMRIHSNEES